MKPIHNSIHPLPDPIKPRASVDRIRPRMIDTLFLPLVGDPSIFVGSDRRC